MCKARKLTKKQGVVLPHANVGDMMLDVDVVRAVEAGTFTVMAVSSVQEAIELFTGKPAALVLDAVRATLARFRKAAGFH